MAQNPDMCLDFILCLDSNWARFADFPDKELQVRKFLVVIILFIHNNYDLFFPNFKPTLNFIFNNLSLIMIVEGG